MEHLHQETSYQSSETDLPSLGWRKRAISTAGALKSMNMKVKVPFPKLDASKSRLQSLSHSATSSLATFRQRVRSQRTASCATAEDSAYVTDQPRFRSYTITNRQRNRTRQWRHAQVQYVIENIPLHGEDASSISSYYHIVADGVSLPSSLKIKTKDQISSSVLASTVVKEIEVLLEVTTCKNSRPLDKKTFEELILNGIYITQRKLAIHAACRLATTLCVAYFDRWNSCLHTFTLGDSKCIVIRGNNRCVFESTAVLREFNVPSILTLVKKDFQVMYDYVVESFPLLEDDICLTFTDGIGDNIYKEDLVNYVRNGIDAESTLDEICQKIVTHCKGCVMKCEPEAEVDHDVGNNLHKHPSPFATAAAKEYCMRVEREYPSHTTEVEGSIGKKHQDTALKLMKMHAWKFTNLLDTRVDAGIRKEDEKFHYNLMQLQRMAQMQQNKPDDMTLLITRFT